MKFKGSFTKSEEKGTEFSSIIKDYILIELEDGTTTLKETGEHDIQPEIDSYKDDCDINMLIARYLNGDTTTGINTQFEGRDIRDIDIDINTAYQKMQELNSNPLFNEFKTSEQGITTKNMGEKFENFLQKKLTKKPEEKKETKQEDTKVNE